MKQNAWDVTLNGNLIDTVFFDQNCDEDYVRKSLIEHDGYDPGIQVWHEVDRKLATVSFVNRLDDSGLESKTHLREDVAECLLPIGEFIEMAEGDAASLVAKGLQNLSRYAELRAEAYQLRMTGRVSEALLVEINMDKIYNSLPEEVKW
jgi:hypothetical protein